jgi:hypothetical protein
MTKMPAAGKADHQDTVVPPLELDSGIPRARFCYAIANSLNLTRILTVYWINQPGQRE